jgi:hypothetical protein
MWAPCKGRFVHGGRDGTRSSNNAVPTPNPAVQHKDQIQILKAKRMNKMKKKKRLYCVAVWPGIVAWN